MSISSYLPRDELRDIIILADIKADKTTLPAGSSTKIVLVLAKPTVSQLLPVLQDTSPVAPTYRDCLPRKQRRY